MNKPDIKHVSQLLMEAPIGQYIGEDGAKILAKYACDEKQIANNEFLYHEGDNSDCCYFIVEGRLALVKENNKGVAPKIIHILEPRDLVGELSFIDSTPYNDSVMALGDATVLSFKAADIKHLINEYPQVIFDFMRAIIKRVHHTVSNISKQQMALAEYISTGGKGRL
ncbi:MAG: cyclic nucleotide-binding domain-containing protein [Methylococcales bacterium]